MLLCIIRDGIGSIWRSASKRRQQSAGTSSRRTPAPRKEFKTSNLASLVSSARSEIRNPLAEQNRFQIYNGNFHLQPQKTTESGDRQNEDQRQEYVNDDGGSLWDGCYNEEESSRDFRNAVRAWRLEGDTDGTGIGSLPPEIKSTDETRLQKVSVHSSETQTSVRDPITCFLHSTNPLNSRTFQESLEECLKTTYFEKLMAERRKTSFQTMSLAAQETSGDQNEIHGEDNGL